MLEQSPNPEVKDMLRVVGLGVVEKVVPLGNKTHNTSLVSEEVKLGDGLTIEELAGKAPSDVYAFKTFRRVEGIVMVGGKKVPVSSQELEESTIFINGKVRGDERFVTTRTGKRFPFNEGDKNIILPKLPGK